MTPRSCAAESLAFEELRHGVGDAVLVAHIVNRQDVRVRQRGQGFGLALETRERLGVERHGLRQDLDRDVAIESCVPRAIDLSHSAGPDRREDLVGAQTSTLGESHVSEMIPGADFSRCRPIRPLCGDRLGSES